MIQDDFKEIIHEIQKNDKEFKMSPRQFLAHFDCGRRTKGNTARIDKFLQKHKLVTEPDYQDTWIGGQIVLKHKKKARSKNEEDPIQRIKLLEAANSSPVSVPKDAKLKEAITLMMMNNYSQLPVMNGVRTVHGVITWESIGYGLSNGVESDLVQDYMRNQVEIIDYETSILDGLERILKNEFALIRKFDNTISGIVTIADISVQFVKTTKPFLLLEQIENHLRLILDGKILVEEMVKECSIDLTKRKVEYIDDLNFGDYIRIIQKPEYWERLNLSIERSHFIKQLDAVREIRNDVMHFDPDGITKAQYAELVKMSNFLIEIRKYQNN